MQDVPSYPYILPASRAQPDGGPNLRSVNKPCRITMPGILANDRVALEEQSYSIEFSSLKIRYAINRSRLSSASIPRKLNVKVLHLTKTKPATGGGRRKDSQ
ncbi:hypothetical protein EVAR_73698_1 [Eumeta japonica]|uniref:Uncharacterized protein n=1 Tax=Eumeta variegata TaxID=151549 RepID=A0A4C1TJQ9_EUMVA|nr:hypothetical protein EVAR_73698_1 [Eumeta japonica]